MSPFSVIPLRLCAALVAAHAALAGNRFIFTLHAVSQGATALQVGLLLGVMMAGPMVLSVQFGRWSDRMGYERLSSAGVAMLLAGSLLASASNGLPSLYVASALSGTGFMLAHVAVNNAIGRLTPAAHTGDAFSVLAMSFSISAFAGAMVSGVAIDHLGYTRAYLATAVFAVASGGLLRWAARRWRTDGDVSASQLRGSVIDLLRDRKLRAVFIVGGLLTMAWDLFAFLAPVHGVRAGLSATATGTVVAAFSVGTFAVRILLTQITRVAGEWRIMAVALVLTALGFLAFPVLHGVGPLVVAAVLLGMSLGCAQPASMALVYRTAPADRVGEAAGFRIAITSFSQTALPMLFGALGTAVGVVAAFWIAAILLSAGTVVAAREARGR